MHLPKNRITDKVKIGVDTGGTFTDFVLYKNGTVNTWKVPSTPDNPSKAILNGLRDLIEGKEKIEIIIHGSTVATNALLERKGARIALITTAGFEDVLFIGRQTRKELFSLSPKEHTYLLERGLSFGLNERTTARGKTETRINQNELMSILQKIRKSGAEAVAVSLINSFANDSNEITIGDALKAEKIPASLSTQILPEYREYERTATTAVNAYLMPVVGKYLSDLREHLKNSNLKIMQSNEGYISPKQAEDEAIRMALSGPAGGVVGAHQIAGIAGFNKIITFDMGGTSTDVSLVDGEISRTNETEISNLPIRIPMIDIHTVGAGGGSIAYIDSGGVLKVGPQSAGADPGPACYGKGNQPTVTDANLLLGRINSEFFLGGRMKIHPERSKTAIEQLAKSLGKSSLETAEGIIRIANSNMEKALRVISIERGVDPRDFYLFSFGGAGGLHAVELAERLKMEGVIVPRNSGVLSALGLLLSDCIKDYSRSMIAKLNELDEQALEENFRILEKRGRIDLCYDGFSEDDIHLHRFLDMRYEGQSYEITIPFSDSDKKTWRAALLDDFQSSHEKIYSYRHPDATVEIVTLRVKAVGKTEKIQLPKSKRSEQSIQTAKIEKQEVIHKKQTYEASVYKRDILITGQQIAGPALVIDNSSTVFVPASHLSWVDEYYNLIIKKKE